MNNAHDKGLHRYAVFTAACTFVLLNAGALVTSNDSGLSIPDWPLAYGSFLPPFVGGIRYEYTHRVMATCVGLLTIGLAVWLWRSRKANLDALAGRCGAWRGHCARNPRWPDRSNVPAPSGLRRACDARTDVLF